MFSNLKNEFDTKLALKNERRTAAQTSSNGFDCEADGSKLQRRYRMVFFTVVAGKIEDGTHEVIVEQSDDNSTFTPTAETTGLLNSFDYKILALRRDPKVGTGIRYVRVQHKISGTVTKGGTLGVLIHLPKDIDDTKEVDIEQVMRHCVTAVGIGAGMAIQSDAIEKLCKHARDNFQTTLNKAAVPAKEWKQVKYFLLACSEEIGRVAAKSARDNFLISIPYRIEDSSATLIGGLQWAYNKVATNNKSGAAGEYCPPDDDK